MNANLVFKTESGKNTVVLNFSDSDLSVVTDNAAISSDVDVVELQSKIESALQEFLDKKEV